MRVATLYGVDWRITPPVTLAVASRARRARVSRRRGRPLSSSHRHRSDRHGARALHQPPRAAASPRAARRSISRSSRRASSRRSGRGAARSPRSSLAVLLDARMSKNEILEIYLNDVYLGHSDGKPVLGIDEASRLYFNKPPSRVARRRSGAARRHDPRAESRHAGEAARHRPRAPRRHPRRDARSRLDRLTRSSQRRTTATSSSPAARFRRRRIRSTSARFARRS